MSLVYTTRGDLDKKHMRILQKYSKQFDIKNPYHIIVDPYFVQCMAEQRLIMQTTIEKVLLERECRLYTTRCCINELQELVDQGYTKFIPGTYILRTLPLLDCLHSRKSSSHTSRNQSSSSSATATTTTTTTATAPSSKNKKISEQDGRWNCVEAIQCISEYIKRQKKYQYDKLNSLSLQQQQLQQQSEKKQSEESNQQKKKDKKENIVLYAYGLQPKSSLNMARNCPGAPTLWVYQNTVVLDKFSPASLKYLERKKKLLSFANIQRSIKSKQLDKKALEYVKKSTTDDNIDGDNDEDTDTSEDAQNEEFDTTTIDKLKQIGVLEHTKGRIRYEPSGGFDLNALPPSKKKKVRKPRSRHKKKNKNNTNDNQNGNNNDNSYNYNYDDNNYNDNSYNDNSYNDNSYNDNSYNYNYKDNNNYNNYNKNYNNNKYNYNNDYNNNNYDNTNYDNNNYNTNNKNYNKNNNNNNKDLSNRTHHDSSMDRAGAMKPVTTTKKKSELNEWWGTSE